MTGNELFKLSLNLWGLLLFPLIYPVLLALDFVVDLLVRPVIDWLVKPR